MYVGQRIASGNQFFLSTMCVLGMEIRASEPTEPLHWSSLKDEACFDDRSTGLMSQMSHLVKTLPVPGFIDGQVPRCPGRQETGCSWVCSLSHGSDLD